MTPQGMSGEMSINVEAFICNFSEPDSALHFRRRELCAHTGLPDTLKTGLGQFSSRYGNPRTVPQTVRPLHGLKLHQCTHTQNVSRREPFPGPPTSLPRSRTTHTNSRKDQP